MVTELRRQYHCYSYNLLIAIICCVQNEHKFYKGFLFQDNTSKVLFILNKVCVRVGGLVDICVNLYVHNVNFVPVSFLVRSLELYPEMYSHGFKCVS